MNTNRTTDPVSPTPDLLRVGEAADLLACTPRHVRNLIYEGYLLAVPINTSAAAARRHIRIKRASLDAFILERLTVEWAASLPIPYAQSEECIAWRAQLRKRKPIAPRPSPLAPRPSPH